MERSFFIRIIKMLEKLTEIINDYNNAGRVKLHVHRNLIKDCPHNIVLEHFDNVSYVSHFGRRCPECNLREEGPHYKYLVGSFIGNESFDDYLKHCQHSYYISNEIKSTYGYDTELSFILDEICIKYAKSYPSTK